jgi:predicted nucleic acid-binding protein
VPTWASHYEEAASLHRICRRGGETVGKLIDCLIASVAIREDIPVLHHDVDYEVLSRHTDLRIELL